MTLRTANPDFSKVAIVEVDKSFDQNATPNDEVADDVDRAAAARLGNWESSGIVDASKVFGHGSFLVTIQAASYWVARLGAGHPRLPERPGLRLQGRGRAARPAAPTGRLIERLLLRRGLLYGLAARLFHHRRELRDELERVTLLHQPLEHAELLIEPRRIDRRPRDEVNFRVTRA